MIGKNMPPTLESLARRIEDLETRGVLYGGQLQYPANVDTIRTIEEASNTFLPSKMFDITWREFFHFISLFEAIDRYETGATPAQVNDHGLVLETTATNGNEVFVRLPVNAGTTTNPRIFSYTKETRFRTEFTLDSVTSCIFSVSTLEDSAGSGMGFSCESGVLYGYTNNGTGGDLQVNLKTTVAVNRVYQLELRYLPQERIVFYVNGDEKGVLATRFPKDLTGDKFIFAASYLNQSALSRTATLQYFEYSQRN